MFTISIADSNKHMQCEFVYTVYAGYYQHGYALASLGTVSNDYNVLLTLFL